MIGGTKVSWTGVESSFTLFFSFFLLITCVVHRLEYLEREAWRQRCR